MDKMPITAAEGLAPLSIALPPQAAAPGAEAVLPLRRPAVPAIDTANVWGLSLARVTYVAAADLVEAMIAGGRPGFFITANLHYAMLSADDERLRGINARAAFLLADGMPLVWRSRFSAAPLPERVTGADLVFLLCERAAAHGHRVFLLGGAAGVGQRAADRLIAMYPGLTIAGIESPPFGPPDPAAERALVARIRQARPDILLVAFGQPKGELWIDRHLDDLGVPACVQIGATLDFVAGQSRRAPVVFQRLGLEWFYRMATEPRRLGPRYARNAFFLLRALGRDLAGCW